LFKKQAVILRIQLLVFFWVIAILPAINGNMKKAIFTLISFLILSTAYSQNIDIQPLKYINLNRNVSLDPSMRFLSNTTTEVCIALPLSMLTYSFIKKDSLNFRKSAVICATVFTSAAVTYVLKHAINRTRPFVTYTSLDPAISVSSASFPSGHTSNSFALATSLSLAYPKWYVIAPSYLWASAVTYSRLHLGVHYSSDILGGIIIGVGSSYLNYKINKLLGNRKVAQKIF
jgi:membrane-associated phospholipid phosphatase